LQYPKKHPTKDFDRLLDPKDLTKRQAAFDTGDVNARGEPGKWAAPSRTPCRNNLARWRVKQAQTLSMRTADDGRHTSHATRSHPQSS